MAAPTVTASLNKASYAPGETATLTVTYSDADNQTFQITVTVTDAENHSGTATVPLVIADPETLSVTDTGNHTWAKLTDNGSVATFSTVV